MIKIESSFDLPLTQELSTLYNCYCQYPFNNTITAPAGFETNIHLLYEIHKQNYPDINTITLAPLSLKKPLKNSSIIIGASGGLDSCYSCLKAKDDGKNPVLVHFKGLNKNYPKETEQIQLFAKINNFPLYIINVTHNGKDYFPDNPFKNQLILTALTEIGITLGIQNIMLGATGTFHISNSKIGFNVTDTIENYNTFLIGLKYYYPLIELQFLDSNVTKYQMLEYIVENHKNSLSYICSCISPNRFVMMLHNNNQKKYNINLLKYRCGSCFKCAMEYILLYEIGYYNNIEFLYHCYEVLAKSKNSHAPELFDLRLPYEVRRKNVLEYKPE